MLKRLAEKYKRYEFVFSELVNRDFKKKYKRSFLGILWSMLAPMFILMVLFYVFRYIFGNTQPHYIIYLFSGLLMFQYYSDATNGAMMALVSNAGIFSKVNVPKYLFLFSRVVSSTINLAFEMVVYFVFTAVDGVPFTWKFILLLFPIGCLFALNIGVGLIISALYVFFKDIQHLYGVFTTALMYFTPIFYGAEMLGEHAFIFNINPLYLYINYVREIVIYGRIPPLTYHAACLAFAAAAVTAGMMIYKKYNHRFLYYV
ncbi:MAG: ABC transporter permease [Gracilibacteraceae bacterium]|jgi:ABC-2 type transport system permease protein|nr:ABC transporter permease [Gracilibacteraceae bacterium]